MTQPQLEIQLVAVAVAVACALPGVFLVLRRLSLLSDAISHTILFGIVVAFLYTRDLASPLLIVGAALTGVLTVSLVELLHRTGLVREDAAIGLVFPALFSLGVILVSRYTRDIHLDVDAVLLGKIELVPIGPRLWVGGLNFGPLSLWVMLAILAAGLAFLLLFYKELKLATFDPALAAALGFAPGVLHYGLMTLVSVTAVGAFDAVGSILVVAFMIGPAATAYLLTDRLSRMLLLSALIGAAAAVSGFWINRLIGSSISGTMATMTGVLFAMVFLAAPERGLVAQALQRARQKVELARAMLAIHLLTHEGKPEADEECRRDGLHEHLRWPPAKVAGVVGEAITMGLIDEANGLLQLTPAGRDLARRVIEQDTPPSGQGA